MAAAPDRRNLITAPLERLLLTLALPTTVEQVLFQGAELIHAYWAGRIGANALSAITVGLTLRLVLISPLMGLSQGGMAVVARRLGERRQELADHALMQVILLLVAFILPLMALGLLLGPTFIGWLGAEGSLAEETWAYLRIIFLGLFFTETLPTLNGTLRAAGHPEQPLRANVVNVAVVALLEPLLVLGIGPWPPLGVRGVALAAVAGSAAGVAYQMLMLHQGWAGLRLHRADLRPDLDVMGRILRVALPTAAQRFSPNLGNALMIRLVAFFGEAPLTAYSLLSRLIFLGQAPANGLGAATGALVGQNLGALQPDRAERAGYLGLWSALGASLLLYGALALWPLPVMGLFQSDQAALAAGVTLAVLSPLWGSGVGATLVLGSALGGAGDAIATMVIGIATLWGLQLPLCWALSRWTPLGVDGLWIGLALASALGALAFYRRFRQGHWRRIEL